ncbi:MAG TPA: acyltransferase [Candidatus Acidoferrum sp.]|jgi:acetyltransferase-like isoleucine patch superfamily enzyme|nr:acyltransferase [Candidatus Acidoferrum sp.]
MSLAALNRRLPWDWYQGSIPANVELEGETHLETTYSFLHYRSEETPGVRLGNGSTVYLGTMFDIGPRGQVRIGQYALVHGAWIICDAAVEIGDYALISWNVVLMDSYRAARKPAARRRQLEAVPGSPRRRLEAAAAARPIRIGRNVWIGFDCCVLPGVTIGEGSVVGARSVVAEDVPAYTLVAGNPARRIRAIANDEIPEAI